MHSSALRHRPLRRPACILVVLCLVASVGRLMHDLGHAPGIAFRYAVGANRAASTVTHTVWGTRTVTRAALPTSLHPQGPPFKPKSKSKPKPPKQELLGAHSYDPSGLLVVNPLGGHPIPELIHHAEAAWAAKLARASITLRQAAAEYTRRYARPPPKGFDMWWAYTAVHDVRLPDEYDQIDRDLAPFYGVAPTDLQEALRALEAHEHVYTIGKNGDGYGGLEMLKLPQDALAAPGFEIIELMREVEAELPPFRAAFNPYDAPNLVLDVSRRRTVSYIY